MPVKRTQLSREQKARYLARAQELRAAGLDCEVPGEWHESSCGLDIFVAPPEGNILCELPNGVTAYAIYVHLVSLRSNFRVENCGIVSDWDSESIVLCSNQGGLYSVGSACEFTEHDALNPRLEEGLHFHHVGDVAEGWVVANGLKPIPDRYRNWMITKISLTFTDQFGHDYSAQAEATLQRSARLRDSDVPVQRSQAAALRAGMPGPGASEPGRPRGCVAQPERATAP